MHLSIHRITLLKGFLKKFSRVNDCTICYETRRLYSLHSSSYLHGVCRECLGLYNQAKCHICRAPIPQDILLRWNIQAKQEIVNWNQEIETRIIEPLNRGIVNEQQLNDILEHIDYINEQDIPERDISHYHRSILFYVPILMEYHKKYCFSDTYFLVIWNQIKERNFTESFSLIDYYIIECEYCITFMETYAEDIVIENGVTYIDSRYNKYATRLRYYSNQLKDKISNFYQFSSERVVITLKDIPQDGILPCEFFA